MVHDRRASPAGGSSGDPKSTISSPLNLSLLCRNDIRVCRESVQTLVKRGEQEWEEQKPHASSPSNLMKKSSSLYAPLPSLESSNSAISVNCV
jgi:hypothetical protein